MKIIILGAIGIALVAGIAIGQHSPRFELIDEQKVLEPHSYIQLDTVFTVFHDRDTGQEIVCILRGDSYDSSSCYLTGRRWGGRTDER